MATFYLLPPRESWEQAVALFFQRHFPGMNFDPSLAEQWLETIQACQTGEVYLIHREDLAGTDTATELVQGFGAGNGDRVIEIGLPAPNQTAKSVSWQIVQPIYNRPVMS